MSSERVFFVGGTGNVGTKAVSDLLEKNVAVTLYARDPKKVESLFPTGDVKVVQGDYSDLAPLKEGIKGHSRLFLLIQDLAQMVNLKRDIATIAYEAGVKQVLDISSESVNMPYRTSYIGTLHYESERLIYAIPNRGRFVTLRPTRFMSNLTTLDRLHNAMFFDVADADKKEGWISPNDIGAIAAVVLSTPIEDHADSVYNLVGDVLSANERSEILSRVSGQDVKYIHVSHSQRFKTFLEFGFLPRYLCFDFVSGNYDHIEHHVTKAIELLLEREPETFEQYVAGNKAAIFGN